MDKVWNYFRHWVVGSVTYLAILLLSLGGTLYAVLYLTDIIAIVVASVLSVVAASGLVTYFFTAHRVSRVLKEVERARDRAWLPELESERLLLRGTLGLTPTPEPTPRHQQSVLSEPLWRRKSLYVRGLELENIRCFQKLGLSFENENGPYLATIILGDNATGKSTLLRSISLGLCPETDAVSLIKTLQGSMLRDGTDQGSIVLHLRSGDRKFEGSIRTNIERLGGREVIRQTTQPRDFPWERIFVCGYGTHRSSGRPASYESYDARQAVASLFSDSADLLNPEVVLLRRDPEASARLESILKQILLLEGDKAAIRPSERGIELAGPWGAQPLSAVSDGYRSTSQWVLDYLGWQMFSGWIGRSEMDGVLLVDELEQHLHPRWQRYFMQRLRAQLGQTQIIASSHTPLIAAAAADVESSQVLRLVPTVDGTVEVINIPTEDLTGKRADQVLADAFGLVTSKSPGSLSKIDRYTELISRQRRTDAEERELETLRKELDEGWSSGDSALKRAADKAVSKVLDQMIDDAREGLDVHVKQRLLELFDPEEAKDDSH